MVRTLRAIFCTLTLIVATFASLPTAGARQSAPLLPITILVSIDGWRWDYIDRFAPDAIGRLARAGVRAEGLIPIFPSKTFPNHYTIVTGQHAARHGIVSNSMVDPALPGRFTLSNRDVQQDTRWWGAEPLWITAERQGRRAATMFWPGSDVEITGRRPTYWRPYEHELPNSERVDVLLSWLGQPEPVRPTFLTLYFSDVDTAGHDAGPDAPETRQAALAIDTAVDRLVSGVERLGLTSRTNFVLVSDHGMATLSPDRVIFFDDYFDVSTVDVIESAPLVGLTPRAGVSADAVYAALRDKHPALKVYTRGTLPEALRLRDHPRLPEVIGIADDGWHPTTRAMLARNNGAIPAGNHGYEPKNRSMHGLFVATGPQFKSGVVVPAFDNIHIYELLCRVLGLIPASNDGDGAVTRAFLR
ncbi:MAG: alkaline phosphatase family protein [Acidobacteria bacterium]|nr:alkaline phosphatase family protein [Acidobacteriota bacterium]